MVINRQVESNYGLFPQQPGADLFSSSQTLSQPKTKEVKALFENAGVIVSMANVGDLQKTLQQVLLSVKDKSLDISRLELSNALASLAASVDGPQQQAALNILALATKTIENIVKNMTMTRKEREELARRRAQAETQQERQALDAQIKAKDDKLASLQLELDKAKVQVSQAISVLGGEAAQVLRGAMRTLAVSAFVRAVQDRTDDAEDIRDEVDVSRQILEIFVGVDRERGFDLGLREVMGEIKSVSDELEARLLERDLHI